MTRSIERYNLDVTTSAGCRVRSVRAAQSRQWATSLLLAAALHHDSAANGAGGQDSSTSSVHGATIDYGRAAPSLLETPSSPCPLPWRRRSRSVLRCRTSLSTLRWSLP